MYLPNRLSVAPVNLLCQVVAIHGGITLNESGNRQIAREASKSKFLSAMNTAHLGAVMKEIKTMHAKGRGVIGMKLIGDGDFKNPEDREKSIRFAMAQPEIHCVVIGFKSTDEIDEAIQRMNRALAEG